MSVPLFNALMVTDLFRLIVDTLWRGLGAACARAQAPLISYLAAADAGGGLDEIVASQNRSRLPKTWTSQPWSA